MTSLQRYEAEAPREWVALLPSAVELAKAVAHTEFVPTGLRGNPAAITAAILYGDEVGLGPMQSLAHIAVIEGRPSLSSEAMRGLVLAAGHEVWVEDASASRVTVGGRRKDSDTPTRVTWTMDDARRAGIAGKKNWQRYPRQMLMARAMAELARAIFADAVGGLAATEELDDSGATDDTAAPDTASGTRRRRRATLAPVSPAPAEDGSDGPHDAASGQAAGVSDSPHSAIGTGLDDAPVPAPADEAAEQGEGDLGDERTSPTAVITDAQRRKMMALYREVGIEEREARLVFARFAVGRRVESSTELTVEEASKVIDALELHRSNP